MMIDEGKNAPAFSLADQEGAMHTLKGFLGQPLVLYFYPKDDTSGCTKEACAFNELLPMFKRIRAAVLGVSPDSSESHAKFASKYDLDLTLLADVKDDSGTPRMCAKYGVWREKSMYGRTYMGIVRTTYLIDARGKVARRWDKVKVKGHAEDVLAAVKELS